MKKVIEELNKLSKSQQDEVEDGIDLLEKALAEFDLDDDLSKSQDGDADDKNGDKDAEGDDDKGEGEGDKDDKDGEGDGEGEGDMEKSLDGDEIFDELVKASECYQALTGEVEAVGQKIEDLAKSNGDLAELVGGLTAAVADLTTLTKSIGGAMVSQGKLLKSIGAEPGVISPAVLRHDSKGEGDTITKSKSEVCTLIKAAIDAGDLDKTDSQWLSIVSVHGPGRLPERIMKTIGL
jgi:hypothetical protein